MVAVHVQDVLLSLMYLSEPLNVEGLPAVVLIRLDAHKGREEVAQFLLHLARVDVRSVEHLSVARRLIQVVHPLHPR